MRRFLLTSLVVLLLVVALLAAALTGLAVRSQHDLSEALLAWRMAGGTTSLADLASGTVPTKDNAAVLYRQAFAALDAISDEELAPVLGGAGGAGAPPPELLARLSAVVEIARRATARPVCVWSPELYTRGFGTEMPWLRSAKRLARVLAADATRRAGEGDHAAAARDLVALHALARGVAADPCLVSALTALGIEAVALDRWEELFRHHELPAEVTSIPTLDHREVMRRAFLGEGAAGLDAFDDPDGFGGRRSFGPARWIVDLDRAYYLGVMRRCVDAAERPYAEGGARAVAGEPPWWASVSRVLVPASERALRSAALSETRAQLAQAALELRAYRVEQGAYPEAWALTTDPLTGRAPRYERAGNAFRMWSESAIEGAPDWAWE